MNRRSDVIDIIYCQRDRDRVDKLVGLVGVVARCRVIDLNQEVLVVGCAFNLEETAFTFTTDSILEAINSGDDPFTTADTEGDADAVALDEGDRPKIHMPISISGFYRFAVPVVDVVLSAELVFGDYARLNAEVNVEGNFFPVNMLSVGLGYTDSLWHAGDGNRRRRCGRRERREEDEPASLRS